MLVGVLDGGGKGSLSLCGGGLAMPTLCVLSCPDPMPGEMSKSNWLLCLPAIISPVREDHFVFLGVWRLVGMQNCDGLCMQDQKGAGLQY